MKSALVIHQHRDAGYTPCIRQCLGALGIDRIIFSNATLSVAAINLRATQFNVDYIFIASPDIVFNIVKGEMGRARKIDMEMWAGTKLTWEDGFERPCMIMLPLYYWHNKPWGKLVIKQHFQKFIVGSKDIQELDNDSPFVSITNATNAGQALAYLSTATLIAIDIETNNHIDITMVGYCARFKDGSVQAYIVDMRDDINEAQVHFIKHANALPQPKVFHNGTYDNQFFLMWNCAVTNYILDTEYLFYSMYHELPRSLAFVSSFYSPVARYWKQMSGTNLAKYCALDCFNTLLTCELMLQDYPAYAIKNYALTFKLVPVVMYTAFQGFNINTELLAAAEVKAQAAVDAMNVELAIMCGGIEVNVNSPKQVPALLYGVLGARKVRVKRKVGGADADTLAKLSEQHPIIRRYCDMILKIREERKAISTYYKVKLLHGRLLFSYRIDGAKTGRLSCTKSNFGYGNKQSDSYGAQAQNIPPYMKLAMIPDAGYVLGENDKSQAEARCTAYIANDRKLIAALESDEDFYLLCGKLFFNISYEDAKPLRQLIKKIIHGSNYMMQADTFIDSVRKAFGTKVLFDAMKMLDRPEDETLHLFADFLLKLYRSTYNQIPQWYKKTKFQLLTEGKTVSALGWTRIFFGDPTSEATLREAVAHQPQNLSVCTINVAFIRAFWHIQIPSNGEFKLICQVHDSIVWQAVKGREDYYRQKLIDIMDIPVQFPSYPEHAMKIPTDGNTGDCWAVCH